MFSTSWAPAWSGPSKLVIVADLADDTSQFVAYGTDGTESFRVQGSKANDLDAFKALMVSEEADLLAPPTIEPLDVLIRPPTIPSAEACEQSFDSSLVPQQQAA